MRVTVKHLEQVVKTTADSRAPSSCDSDIDRQELINNYASEQYLSKWNSNYHGNTESGSSIDGLKELQKPREKKLSDKGLHCVCIEDDNTSLMSYNSVRHGTAPHPGTRHSRYLPYQVRTAPQETNVWQGYSGNMYFDPVRCNSLRINSSKPSRRKPADYSKDREMCSPPTECLANSCSCQSSLCYGLGSLRIASKDDRKRNEYRSHSKYGKLHRGLNDVKEHPARRRCESAPEPALQVAGGHVSVGHTRLTSRSNEFTLGVGEDFAAFVIGRRWDKSRDDVSRSVTRLPAVDTTTATGSKQHKPVFIIPFGALDNVEADSGDHSKRIVKKREKRVGPGVKQRQNADFYHQISSVVKPIKTEKSDDDSHVTSVAAAKHVPSDNASMTGLTMCERNTTGLQIRREISNSSLSNYLRAVPTQPTHTAQQSMPRQIIRPSPTQPTNTTQQSMPRQVMQPLPAQPMNTSPAQPSNTTQQSMPRLAYTQRRSSDIRSDLLTYENSYRSNLHVSQTTAFYGGYLPSTRPANTQYFYADFNTSEAGESDLTSRDDKESHATATINPTSQQHGCSNVKRDMTLKIKQTPDTETCHLPIIGWHIS